jgi:hypothetical protein
MSYDVTHTPGQRPEHIRLLAMDHTRADESWFVLTGHTMMVRDIGRPELVDEPATGARILFVSLQWLNGLSDHSKVLSRACAGSVCGRRPSGKSSPPLELSGDTTRLYPSIWQDEFRVRIAGQITTTARSSGTAGPEPRASYWRSSVSGDSRCSQYNSSQTNRHRVRATRKPSALPAAGIDRFVPRGMIGSNSRRCR